MALLNFNAPAVEVHARCAFPSWNFREQPFREQDFDWQLYVLAVKGDTARMKERWASLPIGAGATWRKIDKTCLDEVATSFGRWVAAKARASGIVAPVFAAIPNRTALENVDTFRTALLAQRAADAFGEGARPFAGLRFRHLVTKEEKRRQGVAELVGNLSLVEQVPNGQVVLVDDVFTEGHHVTAALRVLPQNRAPHWAFVAGRTVLHPLEDMSAEIQLNHYCF